MAFPDDDLARVYADPFATVPVTWGEGAAAVATRGFLDHVAEQAIDGGGATRQIRFTTLRLLASVAGALVVDDQLVADGVTYQLQDDPDPVGDGRELVLTVVRVP